MTTKMIWTGITLGSAVLGMVTKAHEQDVLADKIAKKVAPEIIKQLGDMSRNSKSFHK